MADTDERELERLRWVEAQVLRQEMRWRNYLSQDVPADTPAGRQLRECASDIDDIITASHIDGEDPSVPARMSLGHEIARAQIEKHGRDRYLTGPRQLRKVIEELLELADEIDPPGLLDGARHEYGDAGLALYELGNKLGFDLISCMREVARSDTRDFREPARAPGDLPADLRTVRQFLSDEDTAREGQGGNDG